MSFAVNCYIWATFDTKCPYLTPEEGWVLVTGVGVVLHHHGPFSDCLANMIELRGKLSTSLVVMKLSL